MKHLSEGRPDAHQRSTLAVTTLGIFFATINTSILLISLPAIFRGLHLDPLQPQNLSYLLWLLTGYLMVSAVLVVLGGRLGDIYGRAKVFTIGFAIFTLGATMCALVPSKGATGAIELIAFRAVQGVGGALLQANSTALIVDSYPPHRRGAAVGINQVAAIAGSFLGLLIGGIVSEHSWRAVFWINVPVGVVGTLWAMRTLKDSGVRRKVSLDPWGNLLFTLGLVGILTAMTYGIQPYHGHDTGWTSPFVLFCLVGGIALLGVFVAVESRVEAPLVNLSLFRIRAFTAGNIAGLLGAIARGGQQLVLVVWLQAIWLPLHGYAYADTPLWSGIVLLPLSLGFLVAAPTAGALSDRHGARLFSAGGMVVCAGTFIALMLLPADFPLWAFALTTFLNGVAFGLYASPNATAIMNSVSGSARGAASGIRSMFMNSGQVLSIGLFFTMLIVGVSGSLPGRLHSSLVAAGVPQDVAAHAAAAPPVSSLFAAFLGYDPVTTVLGPDADKLSPAVHARVTDKHFFPEAISTPFMHGIVVVFSLAALMCLLAALAGWLRGGQFVADEDDVEELPELTENVLEPRR